MGEQQPTIRVLTSDDGPAAISVINTAAEWYREFLDTDEINGPEMSLDEWLAENERMTWYGALQDAELLAVMGLEYVGDVALLRHAYVLPDHQRRGVASALNAHLEGLIQGVERIIVGTYAANYKARGILEKGGYTLSADSEAVLRRYFDIPEDRLQSSVTYEKSVTDGS